MSQVPSSQRCWNIHVSPPPDPVTVTGLSMGNPPTSPPGHVGKRLRPSIHPESTTLQLAKSKQKWKEKNSQFVAFLWVLYPKDLAWFLPKIQFWIYSQNMQHGSMSLTKIPSKSPNSSPPWLGMNCTWTVVKTSGRFATWPCILILFYDPGRPLLIYQNSDLFGSINFLGALGDLRIKFQLRHGQLEQMQEQKTRRDGVASPWPTSVKSLKIYGNLMVKSKRKQGIRFKKAKNYRDSTVP